MTTNDNTNEHPDDITFDESRKLLHRVYPLQNYIEEALCDAEQLYPDTIFDIGITTDIDNEGVLSLVIDIYESA